MSSELVLEEASRKRITAIEKFPILEISDPSVTLAEQLVSEGPIQEEAAADALHIAVAAVNGVDYLLTWNCKHLANAALRQRIEMLIEGAGYACPLICTPEELMEE